MLARSLAIAAVLLASTTTLAQGPGPGRGPQWRFDADTTPGWSLMTPEERDAHRAKMMGMQSYDECQAYRDEHHRRMEARAKEKGVALPPGPRQDMCARMKEAGRLK
jgi:hypothetical protein